MVEECFINGKRLIRRGFYKKLMLSPNKILVNSLVRGLLVLECFTPQKHQFTLAELSKLVDIPKSSLYRVVKTLCEMNYLRYDEQNKRYYLGPGVLSLGFAVLQSMEMREIARPYLEKLSRECNKTVNLAILDKHEMVYIERVRVPGLREFNISIGNRIPVWNTAVGKAVLAHLKPETLNEIIKKLKEFREFKGLGNELVKALNEVKKDGYALSDQEFLRGIRAIAVPIFSIDELKNKYAPKLIKTGRELSGALGYKT
jgi:IclR family pca regulon transcriptional regulator